MHIHLLKNEISPHLTSFIKINSKWFIEWNVRPETVKSLEENRREELHNISVRDDFLDIWPKREQTCGIPSHLEVSVRQRPQQSERQPAEGEKIFENHISNKRLIFKTYKEFRSLNSKTNDQTYKWAKALGRHFSNNKWQIGTWKAAQHHTPSRKYTSKPQGDATPQQWGQSLHKNQKTTPPPPKNNKCQQLCALLLGRCTLAPGLEKQHGGSSKWGTVMWPSNPTSRGNPHVPLPACLLTGYALSIPMLWILACKFYIRLSCWILLLFELVLPLTLYSFPGAPSIICKQVVLLFSSNSYGGDHFPWSQWIGKYTQNSCTWKQRLSLATLFLTLPGTPHWVRLWAQGDGIYICMKTFISSCFYSRK